MRRICCCFLNSFLLTLASVGYAQVVIPECPAGEATLLVSREMPTGDVLLNWGDQGCEYAATRSIDPSFPLGTTDTLVDPFLAPASIPYRDSSPPPGLTFYRLEEWDGDWPFWDSCRLSPGPSPTAPVTIAYDNGTPLAYGTGWTQGDIEAVHFIATTPLTLKSIRLRFAGTPGPVQLHIWGDYGRSWLEGDQG